MDTNQHYQMMTALELIKHKRAMHAD